MNNIHTYNLVQYQITFNFAITLIFYNRNCRFIDQYKINHTNTFLIHSIRNNLHVQLNL